MEELQDANAAEVPDGAMMDQNIDDLFGEAAEGLAVDALGVALPPLPPSSSTILRVMEKQNKGCCTKLAWSPAGSIAQIVDDGRQIEFRTMIRDPFSTEWYLSEPSQSPIVAPDGSFFEHIQFSRIGVDLATIDNAGHVRVYTLVATLSKMNLSMSNITANEVGGGDLDNVVALHWLPMSPGESKFPYISPAMKVGDKWTTHLVNSSPNEPSLHHPADKRHALFYISRKARITLMYQIEAVWHATSAELEIPNSSSEQLSHAAMNEQGDQLLLVTHDLARRFRLYRIAVNWNSMQNTRPSGPPYISVNPTLQIARLTVLEHVAAQQADLAVLSDLRLIAPITPNIVDAGTENLPTVVAVFTRVCAPGVPTQQHVDSFSIVSRWQIENSSPVVMDFFKKLPSGGNNQPQIPTTVLRRLDDNLSTKIIMSVKSHQRNMLYAFCTSDGTVEFRDRLTMTVVEPYGDTTTVSSLPQSGFEHTPSDHVAHIAMAPSGSMLAIVSSDGKMETKVMSLRFGWHATDDGLGDARGLMEAAIVCLAREYTTLSCYQASNDDILACLPLNLSEDLRGLFIRSIIEMQGRSLDLALADHSKQNMHAVKETLLRSALSAQYVINRAPLTMKSNWSAKYGFAFLNARAVCFAIAQSVSRPDAMVPPPLLLGLRGLARWGCDFLVYITDALITLWRSTELISKKIPSRPIHEIFMEEAMERESPIINLILSTFTRSLFRFMSVLTRQYLISVQKSLQYARSVNERTELEDTCSTLSKLPFKLSIIDNLAGAIDEAVRAAYNTKNVSSDRRSEIELYLMTDSTISPELHSALQKIIETIIPTFMKNVDMAALYCRDTTWLGIEPRAPTALREYDIMRKLPLARGVRLRVCRRCGAVTEDPSPEALREVATSVLAQTFRQCVCGNYWVLERVKEGGE